MTVAAGQIEAGPEGSAAETLAALPPAPVLAEDRGEPPGRGGYRRVFRLAGPRGAVLVQEVVTEIEFLVDGFALVRYLGRYLEFGRPGDLDVHALSVWRDRWDQRGVRALLRERLAEPSPALELLQEGEASLRARKQFRLGWGELEDAGPDLSAGYLAGAAPARLELAAPSSSPADGERVRLALSPYPGGVAPAARAEPLAGQRLEAEELFRYDFATCQASLDATLYRSLG